MRLPFRIPEYAPRITWASPAARAVWEPRIAAISAAWLQVERASVAERIRPSALQNVTPEELPALMSAMAKLGLTVLPLGRTANTNGYQSASRALDANEPWAYRCAITRPEHVQAWTDAWAKGDDDRIGTLLGTPACCRAFFEQVWKRERWMDTTWPMTRSHAASPSTSSRASGAPDTARSRAEMLRDRRRDIPLKWFTLETHDKACTCAGCNQRETFHISAQDSRSEAAQRPSETRGEGVEVSGINMLWRWHGVRLVSHLPCSFECEASLRLGLNMLAVMGDFWHAEAEWIAEILMWPVKWTALHGIAEITTPIHRTSVATDATDRRLEVRYLGTGYPAEGAIGVDFPHRTRTTPTATLQVARPSAQNPAVNGFSTLAAMHEAHQRLLQVIGPGPYRTVLDLGCGDGTLLSRIPATRRIGVDSRALDQVHSSVDRVVIGDCTDPVLVAGLLAAHDPDLVIAQRVRNPPEMFPGRRVLSYSYENGADAPRLIEVPNGTAVRFAVG